MSNLKAIHKKQYIVDIIVTKIILEKQSTFILKVVNKFTFFESNEYSNLRHDTKIK